MKLDKNLREFIELLNSHGVEFLVVGGHAVAFHGHPRFTGDIDFFVAIDPATADQLLAVIDAFGFGGLGLTREDFLKTDAILQIGYPPNRIDIATGIEGVGFGEAWHNRVAGEIDEMPVHFIDRDLLLKNKRAAGRPKDIADVDALESQRGSSPNSPP